jgi:ADP-heptose:LPS heptosyltransferase
MQSRRNEDYSTLNRIVVFQALFLGDLLLATPALRALRAYAPNAEITLIGLPWAAEFVPHIAGLIDRFVPFVGYPGLQEVAHDEQRTARFLGEQQAYSYDLAVQLHGDGNVSNGLVAALGARTTLGYARPSDTRLMHALPYRDDTHQVRRWLALAEAIGAPVLDTRLAFDVLPADARRAQTLLQPVAQRNGPLVGLHLGAKAPERRWPVARFAQLGEALHNEYGASLVLTGSAPERALIDEILHTMRAPALDLGGQTDLGALAAVVAELDLLVSNDTGVAHLATATQTPSVVLFGPTHPWQWGPLDRALHQVVDARALLHQSDGAAALRRLSVAPVLTACQARLGLHTRAVGAGATQ